jgi:hypothetical protein
MLIQIFNPLRENFGTIVPIWKSNVGPLACSMHACCSKIDQCTSTFFHVNYLQMIDDFNMIDEIFLHVSPFHSCYLLDLILVFIDSPLQTCRYLVYRLKIYRRTERLAIRVRPSFDSLFPTPDYTSPILL